MKKSPHPAPIPINEQELQDYPGVDLAPKKPTQPQDGRLPKERRNFFAMLLAPLVAKFAPKQLGPWDLLEIMNETDSGKKLAIIDWYWQRRFRGNDA